MARPPVPAALEARPGNVLSLIGMLLIMAGVLALAWAVSRWIGRHGASGFAGGSGDERFQVLRQIGLGQGQRLLLVRLGERCLLVGVASGGVSLLAELSEEEARSWLPQGGQENAAPPSFWEAVQKNLPRRK